MHIIRVLLLSIGGMNKSALESRLGIVLFVLGKFLRFGFFIFFLIVLLFRTKGIGGYSLWEVMIFYLTFNMIDTTAQLLFRNVYRFRGVITSGMFDLVLLNPFSPLIRSLLGGADLMDLPMFLIFFIGLVIGFMHLNSLSIINILLYILLIGNALIIAAAFHIFVLALGIITTAVDNTIMLYRDLTQMGRFPIDIYKDPLKSLITFVVPVGIMMTFPVKVLLGVLSFWFVIISCSVGLLFLFLSLWYWKYAISKYSSASS